jgi:hypothetical protein
MRLTRPSVILGIVGIVLLVAAALVRWVVLPSASKLPSDLDTTQSYSGTYTGVNPIALTGTSAVAGLVRQPVTASRHYRTTGTSGNTAIVTRTLDRSQAGQVQPATTLRYAIDRSTFESTSPPSGTTGVAPSKGLVFTLPLHPSTTASYRLWDEATAAAYPLTYQGSGGTVQDRSTLAFRSHAKGTLANPALYGLPTSVSSGRLAELAPTIAGSLPQQLQALLPTLLARLPASVPLIWTSDTTSTLWADQTTGAPIKVQSTQNLSAGISLAGQTVSVPLGTIALVTTAASDRAIAGDAASNASKLTLVGTTIPLVLLALGVVAIGIALVLAARAGRPPAGPAPAEPVDRSTPAPV